MYIKTLDISVKCVIKHVEIEHKLVMYMCILREKTMIMIMKKSVVYMNLIYGLSISFKRILMNLYIKY